MPSDETSISVVINGETFQIWDEGVKESYNYEALSDRVTWTMLCAWTDRIGLRNALQAGGGAPWPDAPQLVVRDVDIKPVGVPAVGASGFIAYPWARLAITFRYPDPDDLGSEDLTTSVHGIALDQDKASFQWDGDDKEIPPSAAPVMEFTTMTLIESRIVASLDKVTWANLIDKVNSGSFLGFSAEKVVYRGLRSHRKIATGGDTAWHVEHSFEIHVPATWNQLFRPSSAMWEDFVKTRGSGKLFPTADLSVLLP